MASTTTVRVTQRTREAINRLSRRHGKTTAELLDEIVSRLEENELLNEMNDAFAQTRANPDAWEAERRERADWDATLIDGLAEL